MQPRENEPDLTDQADLNRWLGQEFDTAAIGALTGPGELPAKTNWDDALKSVLAYYNEAEEDFADPEGPLESGLRWELRYQVDPWAIVDQLRALLAGGLSDPDLHYWAFPYSALPGGRDIRRFLEYLLTRVEAVAADPSLLDVPAAFLRGGLRGPLHRGVFTNERTANAAATAVLQAHEAQLLAWSRTACSPQRLYLSADVGRRIGKVIGLSTDGDPDPQHAVRTSHCAVVMMVHGQTGEPFIGAAYPELAPVTDAAARYPDLPQYFGAFFNQDAAALSRSWWRAEQLAADLPRDQLGVIAGQLRLLLDTHADGDPGESGGLAQEVHALGGCLDARHFPRWVEGLFRRLTRLYDVEPVAAGHAG